MTPEARDYFARMRREHTRSGIVLAELARQGRPVLFVDRTGRHPDRLVHRSTAPSGGWRMTWFDGDLPMGHVEHRDAFTALRATWTAGDRMEQL